MIYILLEPIETNDLNLNNFNVFDIHIHSEQDIESTNRLWYLISSALNRKVVNEISKESKIKMKDELNFKAVIETPKTLNTEIPNKYLGYTKKQILDIPENNHNIYRERLF